MLSMENENGNEKGHAHWEMGMKTKMENENGKIVVEL
jgi:hypothetical protein